MDAIFERRSIRNFHDKPVEEEKVNRLLQAGMAAPSAGNQQPWEFYRVDDRSTLSELAESSPYAGPTKNSALAIIPCYQTEGLRFKECVEQDMSACTQNILLEATHLELGAVWMCIAPVEDRIDNVRRILSLPENLVPFCIIGCGYPAESKQAADRYDETRIHRI